MARAAGWDSDRSRLTTSARNVVGRPSPTTSHPARVLEGALLEHRPGQLHQVQRVPRRAAHELHQPVAGFQASQLTDQLHRGVLGEVTEPDVDGPQPQQVLDGARDTGRMLRADHRQDCHRPKCEPSRRPA
jgi:hypothetical protein